MYGVEKTAGLKEHLRVMQKRGKILVAEDFNPLTETYPVHPLTMEPRRHQDRTDMMNKRKEGACEEAAKERDLWDKANPYFIDRKYIKPEGYVDSPLYTSVNQIRKEKRKNERVVAGLTVKPTYQKDPSNDPTTAFVNCPVVNCRSELNIVRKKR
jgi:hypothetical protein